MDLLQSKGKKPRKGEVLKCPECGAEFYAAPGQITRRVYCSRACKHAAHLRQVRTTCEHCGAEFNHAKSIGGKYCQWACYVASRQPRTTCKQCGTPLPRSALTYCSAACADRGHRTGTMKLCEVCNQEMYVPAYLAQAKRFCSRVCANRAKEIDGPGAKWYRPDGYVMVYYPKHPDATKAGWIMEHRLVAEQNLGRRIGRDEQVHHKNEIRSDNRWENLEVIPGAEHTRVTVASNVKKARSQRAELEEYRRRFGPLTTEEEPCASS